MWSLIIRVAGAGIIGLVCNSFTEVLIAMAGIIIYGAGVMFDYMGDKK